MTGIRQRLTYANVVASLALFVALGGSSYAAVQLSKNSVRSKHIKNGQVKRADLGRSSVTSAKVKDGDLLASDFKAGELAAGPAGPQGPKGDQGIQGPKGDTGSPGAPASTTQLQSGQTLRGTWAYRGYANAGGQDGQTEIEFGVTLPAAPTTHFIENGAAPPAGCSGTPSSPNADPGHLCVFESAAPINAAGRVFDPVGGANDQSSPFGAGVAATATAAGDFRVRGSWAVTAP